MSQLARVERAMLDGEWHTLAALSKRLRIAESCLSAHVRSLRKPRHGGHTVERRYDREDRVYLYRLNAPVALEVDVDSIVQDICRTFLSKTLMPSADEFVGAVCRQRMDEVFRAT